jgi:hypothetical protein
MCNHFLGLFVHRNSTYKFVNYIQYVLFTFDKLRTIPKMSDYKTEATYKKKKRHIHQYRNSRLSRNTKDTLPFSTNICLKLTLQRFSQSTVLKNFTKNIILQLFPKRHSTKLQETHHKIPQTV